MNKFVWGALCSIALFVAACGSDTSVPSGAQDGWTEQSITEYMTSCEQNNTELSKIIDVRKACRCVVERVSPKMTFEQFSSGIHMRQERVGAFRDCRKEHRYNKE